MEPQPVREGPIVVTGLDGWDLGGASINIDGAVGELHRDADGTVTADVRIPAHQDGDAG